MQSVSEREMGRGKMERDRQRRGKEEGMRKHFLLTDDDDVMTMIFSAVKILPCTLTIMFPLSPFSFGLIFFLLFSFCYISSSSALSHFLSVPVVSFYYSILLHLSFLFLYCIAKKFDHLLPISPPSHPQVSFPLSALPVCFRIPYFRLSWRRMVSLVRANFSLSFFLSLIICVWFSLEEGRKWLSSQHFPPDHRTRK